MFKKFGSLKSGLLEQPLIANKFAERAVTVIYVMVWCGRIMMAPHH